MAASHARAARADDGARSLADAALELAAVLGPVFPLAPRGKVPLIPRDRDGRGCHDATADRDQIKAWWRRWPSANIGVHCTTIWALDVDADKGGLDTLADLEDLNRWLPEVVTNLTPGGGMHLLFAADPRVRNSVKRLGPGLDTRAAGGYVVAPPSIGANGTRYCWLPGRAPGDVPIAPAPEWLISELDPPEPAVVAPSRPKVPRVASRYVDAAIRAEIEAVALARQGERNAALFRAALALGRFVRSGELSASDIAEPLVSAAALAGLPRIEAERTCLSGLRTAARGER